MDNNSKWICPKCGKELGPGAMFCGNCGTKKPENAWAKPEPKADAQKFCGNCGKKLSPGAVFCPECGAKVQDQKNNQVNSRAQVNLGNFSTPMAHGPIDLRSGDAVVKLTAAEAEEGCRKDMVLPDGRDANISLPGGIADGSKLKLNQVISEETGEPVVLDIKVG